MPFKLTDRLAGGFFPRGEGAEASSPKPVSVIDIGSNSVRLVVYDGAMRAPTPMFNEKVLCGLGKSVGSTGKLGDEPVQRAVEALNRFRAINRALGVGFCKAVATAAVREAADGNEFIERAITALDCEIEVLSGEREAELAARGIFMGFTDADGVAGDLGGGSLELTSIRNGKLENAISVPLGMLRLTEASQGKLTEAGDIAKRTLDGVDWLQEAKPDRFFAVGGTWRALAKLHMEQNDYPLRVMHHYALPFDEALTFAQSLRKARKSGQLEGIDVVSRPRRDYVPMGAIVMERTLLAVRPREVVMSVFGIREGLVYEMLSAAERKRDPLIRFCENYADVRSRGGALVGHSIHQWLSPVIDAYSSMCKPECKENERLRLAACLLSDIGWRAHPDYRGEQCLNVVAHAGMTGIDHAGRLFLALVVYYRHKGSSNSVDALSEQLQALAGPEQLRRARLIATALRAADVLCFGTAGILRETQLSVKGDVLRLHLPQEFAMLNGERIQRRFRSLAQQIDRDFAVVLEP